MNGNKGEGKVILFQLELRKVGRLSSYTSRRLLQGTGPPKWLLGRRANSLIKGVICNHVSSGYHQVNWISWGAGVGGTPGPVIDKPKGVTSEREETKPKTPTFSYSNFTAERDFSL